MEHAKALNEAIQRLQIHAVNLKTLEVSLNDSHRAVELDELDLELQARRSVRRCRQASPADSGSNGVAPHLVAYLYTVDLAMRESETPEAGAVEAQGEEEPLFHIKASYEVEYLSDGLLEESLWRAFAVHNVGYNVWPYWRELVHSLAGRMGVSPSLVTVPLYQIPRAASVQNADADRVDENQETDTASD